MIGLISASAWAQQRGEIVEIGQATTTTTLSPIYTPMNYSYSQQLYTAEEIGASGTINSIASIGRSMVPKPLASMCI